MPALSPRPSPPDGVTPRRVLVWLDRLRAGIAARDEMFVWELFGYREARVAPRAVLEEALALVRAPQASARAPLALLRFAWVVDRLDAAGEPMPGVAHAMIGAADDAPGAAAGEDPDVTQLEFAWPHRAGRRRPA